MYTNHYHLKTKPFDIIPDPDFLYPTKSHREALSSMVYGIKEKKGLISITGEVGTGKTTLIYSLLKNISNRINTVFVYHTNISFEQLLKKILIELNIAFSDTDKISLLQKLNDYLIDKYNIGEITVIIIDEAQNLQDSVLEELRMLSNLETSRSKLLQIVLVGQPELETKLNTTNLRQLKQRISIRQQVLPLTFKESKEYILHRLQIAGGSLRIFSGSALDRICTYSNGIPRTINVLCDNALLIGYSKSAKKIGLEIIDEVISDMEGIIPPQKENLPPATNRSLIPHSVPLYYKTVLPLCILLTIIVTFCISLFFLQNNQEHLVTENTSNAYKNKTDVPINQNPTANPNALRTKVDHQTKSTNNPMTRQTEPTVNTEEKQTFSSDTISTVPLSDKNEITVSDDPATMNTDMRHSDNNTMPLTLKARINKSNKLIPPQQTDSNSPADSSGSNTKTRYAMKIKDTVTAQKGTTLFKLARQYYNSDNITFAYIIKKANPQIRDIHKIKLNQDIIIPVINCETPLIKIAKNSFNIDLGTFRSLKDINEYVSEPFFLDKEFKIVPVSVSSTEIWYRVILEKFKSKKEGLSVVLLLKEKGLIPYFTQSTSDEIKS